MMEALIRGHKGYYFSLLSILFLGISLVFGLSYDRKLQILAVFITAFCYLILGIMHHLVHHDLTVRIVVEYVLIVCVGILIYLFILQGGYL